MVRHQPSERDEVADTAFEPLSLVDPARIQVYDTSVEQEDSS